MFLNQMKTFSCTEFIPFKIEQLATKWAAIKKRERGSLNVNTYLVMENTKAFKVIWENYPQNVPILEELIY